MALYFLRTVLSPTLTALLAALILLAFGVFGGGMDRLDADAKFFPRLKKFLGVTASVVGIYLLVGVLVTEGFILPRGSGWLSGIGSEGGVVNSELIAWETELEEGMERASREGKPVLIDTWATWCVNCRVLDRKTFGNPDVAAEAERFVAIKVQLETAGSPVTKAFMERFGLRHYSLPTTLLIGSSGKVRKVLKGVVGPEEMIEEMRRVR
jgi:thiol:disulfide interchange protein DsbD